MKLLYTSRAKDDIEIAFLWYEKQRRGLGFEFLDCVDASINSIISNPKLFSVCYSRFRRCVIRRFPFSIFYTIEDFEIIIHSIFDNRQNPEKRP